MRNLFALMLILALSLYGCTKEPANQTEKQITAIGTNNTSSQVITESKELTVKADDDRFYPSEAIIVKKGTKIKMNFVIAKDDVYYGGLEFRSSAFPSLKGKPGDTLTAQFTADKEIKIESFWPASGVKKSELLIKVE